MPDRKPTGTKIAIALLLLKIALPILTMIIYSVIAEMELSNRGILAGIRAGIEDWYGLNLANSAEFNSGLILGRSMFPIVASLGALYAILSRRFTWVVVTLLINLVFDASSGFPIMVLLILVLCLINPTRNYLRIRPSIDERILDSDLDNLGH